MDVQLPNNIPVLGSRARARLEVDAIDLSVSSEGDTLGFGQESEFFPYFCIV